VFCAVLLKLQQQVTFVTTSAKKNLSGNCVFCAVLLKLQQQVTFVTTSAKKKEE